MSAVVYYFMKVIVFFIQSTVFVRFLLCTAFIENIVNAKRYYAIPSRGCFYSDVKYEVHLNNSMKP